MKIRRKLALEHRVLRVLMDQRRYGAVVSRGPMFVCQFMTACIDCGLDINVGEYALPAEWTGKRRSGFYKHFRCPDLWDHSEWFREQNEYVTHWTTLVTPLAQKCYGCAERQVHYAIIITDKDDGLQTRYYCGRCIEIED